MVFGNMGETSATGVAFTRDPASGEKVFYGEYLINAQGEDVVAGVRTPHPIADLAKEMPAAHKDLMKVRALLESHFKDMQDLEFTVEGKSPLHFANAQWQAHRPRRCSHRRGNGRAKN